MTERSISPVCSRFALAALLVTTTAYSAGEHLSFRHYSFADGLQHHTVRAMTQDRTGYLWIGTASGLYRFDGVRFTRMVEGLLDARSTDSAVRAVHGAPDGAVWVATNQGLFYLSQDRFQRSTLPEDGTILAASSVASDSDGRLYVATSAGVYLSEPGPARTRQFVKQPTPSGPANGLWIDAPWKYWTGCGDAICRVDAGRVTVYGPAEGVPAGSWKAFARDRAGRVWARDKTTLISLPLGGVAFSTAKGIPRSKAVESLAIDPYGNVAVPTQFGLYLNGAHGFQRLGRDSGLPDNPVCCLLWDREGSPWIGLEAYGVARWLGSGRWTHVTEAEGLSNNSVTSIARAGGRLWIGTESGLNEQLAGGRWRPAGSLPSEPVRCLETASDGALWIGLANSGLMRVDPRTGAARPVGAEAGIANTQVVSLTSDRAGMLWVATRGGVFRGDPKARPLRFDREGPESRGTVYRVRLSGDGTLWMSSLDGLFYRDKGAWKRFSSAELQPSGLVFMSERVPGELWLGYGKSFGVSRVRIPQGPDGPVEVTHYRAPDTLASDEISFLETDQRGWLWVGTDQGISVFDGRQWHALGTEEGLSWPDTVFDAFHADSDGVVWVGTHRGAARFQPPQSLKRPSPPPVALTGVTLGRKPDAVGTEGLIEGRERSFRAAFAALTFQGSAQMRYRYRLVGLSDQWVETSLREAVYSNLDPGRYVFEVQAAHAGSWEWGASPAQYAFVVAPGIWETGWFRAYLALTASFVAWAWWKRREWRLRRLNAELELAVLSRTSELEMEKQRAEQALEEAREASRLKSEFLANVSHEIRTPMNGVLGMAALALETPLSAEQREYIETIRSAGGSLLQLLNDILDFSKIEAGHLELETTPFALSDIVEGAIRTAQFTARQKSLSLSTRIEPGVPETLAGDPVRLRQVLINLLSNAVKFTSEGSVLVVVRPAGEGRIEFEISDTGIGIPADKLWVIFDPFRQADGSTTRKYGGTGLGLAICRRLVALMGGEIAVESEQGKGSVFRFTIQPADAPAEIEPQFIETLSPKRPLRILLVDDNRVSRLIAERLLEKRGHDVVSVEGGREALGLFNESEFDAVVMDMQMPDLDGIEATRRIREIENGAGRRTPVVMLTANAMDVDRAKALEAGADVHLAKPVQPQLLFAMVERLAGDGVSPAVRSGSG